MEIFSRPGDISPYPDFLSRLPHLDSLARFTCFVTYLASGIKVALSTLPDSNSSLQEVATAG